VVEFPSTSIGTEKSLIFGTTIFQIEHEDESSKKALKYNYSKNMSSLERKKHVL
jgi:hypothetical protein